MAKTNWGKLFTWTAAVAGVGTLAVVIVRMLREKGESVDTAIDELLDFYNGKAAELDRLVTETELRMAN